MKTKIKNSIIAACCVLAFGAFSSFSPSEGWTLLNKTEGVEGYVQQIDCRGTSILSFKLKNTTSEDVAVEYTMDAKMNPTIPTVTKTIFLKANSEVYGNCDSEFELALPDYGEDKDITKRAQLTVNIKK